MFINVFITEQCNLDCSFCYVYPKKQDVLNIDAFLEWFHIYKEIIANEYIEPFFSKGETVSQISKMHKTIENSENVVDKNNIYMKKGDIEVRFFGGEPMLQATNVWKIIEGTKASNIRYDICTNLVYEITPEIAKILDFCSISSSWDPISLRFKTEKNFELWKNNYLSIIKNKSIDIGVMLTKEILEMDPYLLFKYLASLKINSVQFQKMRSVGKAVNLMSPTWEEVDDWLCKAYDVKIPELTVNMFDKFANICKQKLDLDLAFALERAFEYEHNQLNINADGTISISSLNYTKPFSNIFNYNKNDVKGVSITTPLKCRICNLYKYCDCNNSLLSWQLDACTFPIKLFKKIMHEYNIQI